MANSILTSLVLTAKDGASGILSKIEANIGALGKTSAASTNSLQGLTGAFSGAILQTSLLTSGFGLIIGAAEKGMDAIEGQFGKARELQQTFVGNASSLAAQTGRSFDESMGVITAISTEITKQASSLPGVTQAYKDLGNTLQGILIRGYVDKKGNVDFAGFGRSVEGLATNYGALSQGKGMNPTQAQLFLQRGLAGGSLSELSQIEFGIRSPEVINGIEPRYV